MPETGAKWTQEKLTDLQFLVETGGSCKIQLQNLAGNLTTLQADLSKRGFMLPIPGGDVAIRVEGSVRFAN
jgi:hypothetical protein